MKHRDELDQFAADLQQRLRSLKHKYAEILYGEGIAPLADDQALRVTVLEGGPDYMELTLTDPGNDGFCWCRGTQHYAWVSTLTGSLYGDLEAPACGSIHDLSGLACCWLHGPEPRGDRALSPEGVAAKLAGRGDPESTGLRSPPSREG